MPRFTSFLQARRTVPALLLIAAACSSEGSASKGGPAGAAGAVDASADQSLDAGVDSGPDQGAESSVIDGGCVPRTCAQIGANCGEAPDDCGGSIACGECPSGQTCGGGGENQCGSAPCSPRTCAQTGTGCGKVSDGCSGVLDCGECPASETCGGAGIPFQCGCQCTLSHAVTSCSAQGCAVQSCDAGFADCNGVEADGCEVAITSDAQNCGVCGNACSFGNAVGACLAGSCKLSSCNDGYADCDQQDSNGCEANILVNPAHCGSCDHACPSTGGKAVCINGGCSISDCNEGLGDCDNDESNGCETNLLTGWKSCGACGNVCNMANATPACVQGACAVSTCLAGYGNCDSEASNGCETALASSPQHCGSCETPCPNLPGTMAVCVGGSCSYVCGKFLGDCDGQVLNGCETPLNTNTDCGQCGMPCAFPNALATCDSGTCNVTGCALGYADCNGLSIDGCETNTKSDPSNCGSCGHACGPNYVCNKGLCTCLKPCDLECCGTGQKCCNGEQCYSSTMTCPLPR